MCIPQSEYHRILSQGEENIQKVTENGEVVVVTEYRTLDGGNRHGHVVIKVRQIVLFRQYEENFWMKLSRISVLFRLKSALDNADRGLNNCDILRKPNTIIILLFMHKQNKPSCLSLLLST